MVLYRSALPRSYLRVSGVRVVGSEWGTGTENGTENCEYDTKYKVKSLIPRPFLSLCVFPLIKTLYFLNYTVKPRFTGPIGGKELGPVNREALYIGVHFTLIYT